MVKGGEILCGRSRFARGNDEKRLVCRSGTLENSTFFRET
jgi:hypothetical protein